MQSFLWSHISDDSYISFRYMRRFMDGKGLTFNDGERVEGFSHPLWIFLVAGCSKLSGFAVSNVARMIGLTVALLSVACLFVSRRALVFGNQIGAATIVLLLVFPGFHAYATSGLETPLFMFLVTLGTVASIAKPEPSALASLSFGCAAITRPEGILCGLAWFAIQLFSGRDLTRARLLRACRQFAILLTPALAYQVFRVMYFEAWLPNTFLAKLPGTFGSFLGLGYMLQVIMAVGGPFLLGALLVVVPTESEDYRKVRRAAIGPILASAAFVFYAWGDWMPFSRFVVPVWPSLALLLASWLVTFSHSLNREMIRLKPARITALLTACIVASTLVMYGAQIKWYARNEGFDSMLMGAKISLELEHGYQEC